MEKDMDLKQRSLSDDLTQEKDTSKQLQNHLNPSSSTEAQILSGAEIVPTGNSGVLSETVTHSAASHDRSALRRRNTASKRTARTYVDGYSWKKCGEEDVPGSNYPSWRKSEQEDVPVSEYPSGYFRCPYHKSEGCLALKVVLRSHRVRASFEVTHLGKHTCKRFSHLATSAAVEPTEAASDDKEVSGRIEAALMWTVADGYSWRKEGQKAIAGYEHPRENYGCPHSSSQGCPATKHVQSLNGLPPNSFPPIFLVTYEGRHTCKQSSSHLPQLIEAEAKEKPENTRLVQRLNNDPSISEVTSREGHMCEQSSSHLPQPIEVESKEKPENTRLVQRSNNGPSISEVTSLERHTCEQSSSHLPQLIEAESKEKPEKSEMVSFMRILLVASFVLELCSAVFDQLSSVRKPHYALILMLLSYASLVPCIVRLVNQGRKKRVSRTRGKNNRNSFSNVAEIVGCTCAVCQSILTTANYVLLITHTKIRIQINVWPVIFAFVLLCSEFRGKTDKSGRERRLHNEV